MKVSNRVFFRLFVLLFLSFFISGFFTYYVLKLEKNTTFIFFTILNFSLILSFSISFIIFFKTKKKLKLIADGLDKLKELNFDAKIIIEENESYEFSKLFENFNKTTTILNTFFNDLKIKSKIENFFSYLKDASILIDSEGKILKVNNSFIELFNLHLFPINKYLWEIVRNNKILEDINELVSNLTLSKTNEVEINGKSIIYHINKLTDSDLIFIIFHDVTKIKKLDTIKKDFITNLTHELMSPLTAVNGYLEILTESLNKKEEKELILTIKKNTERMIKIVKDLLFLSSLENELTYKNIIFEEANLNKLIENVIPLFKDKIEKKGLTLITNIPETLKLECDPFKIEQLIINLLDNAIKYSDKGEIRITAKRLDQKNISIEISDEGIGIPEEYLDRIFERFFVVDKSRSKTNAGTGLGLSIVKHIVFLHKGEIKVESKVGFGTKFTINLPIKHS